MEGCWNTKETIWMRTTCGPSGLAQRRQRGQGCRLNTGESNEAMAAIEYEDAQTVRARNRAHHQYIAVSHTRRLQQRALDKTVPALALPVKNADTALRIDLRGANNATHAFVWYMERPDLLCELEQSYIMSLVALETLDIAWLTTESQTRSQTGQPRLPGSARCLQCWDKQ